jgi:hypothetical protein
MTGFGRKQKFKLTHYPTHTPLAHSPMGYVLLPFVSQTIPPAPADRIKLIIEGLCHAAARRGGKRGERGERRTTSGQDRSERRTLHAPLCLCASMYDRSTAFMRV